MKERNIGEVIESTQKENKTAKEDRVIQTFKAEHEKLRGGGAKVMEELEKALNESGMADGNTEVHQSIERGCWKGRRDEQIDGAEPCK